MARGILLGETGRHGGIAGLGADAFPDADDALPGTDPLAGVVVRRHDVDGVARGANELPCGCLDETGPDRDAVDVRGGDGCGVTWPVFITITWTFAAVAVLPAVSLAIADRTCVR